MVFNLCHKAFKNDACWIKARELAYGALTCMGRRTITGMLTSSGQQFLDWSSAYRLFSKNRVDTSKLFDICRQGVIEELGDNQMIVGHMDDTILKKTGKKIPGAAWRRDPLGPPFQTNLIWGQRFLQISIALPDQQGYSRSRAIPVDFHHCPTAKKPGKNADEKSVNYYKEQKQKLKLSMQGSERLDRLRGSLDNQGAHEKQLVVSVDGSYTNAEVLKKLPDRVTLIGRVRKDTKIYALPEGQLVRGRKRVYGAQLPTPEGIRQSDQYPVQEVNAWAAGKVHKFKIKTIKHVRWRSAGEKHDLQLVIIKPLGYRLTKSSPILYRDPAYLICTDPKLNIESLLQAYLWRWEIEVNFREEKTLLGCGQAQVRNPESVQSVPAFMAAMYALLLLASYRSLKSTTQNTLPRPKWYQKKPETRYSTGDILNNFRAQLWSQAVGLNFSGFVKQEIKAQSLKNRVSPSISAMFYFRN